ncbi:P-loop containing nucleoside triphosphate hydrolase protein [Aulographum hederae CBS 113979]|uniref:ATP-dependent RNA helicase n=1 Tax=Aulographum hederae CBS 113979 TaxID=1176131 RepID=A0A6G1GZE1_9PEZI|nr:P-loop containing nucleoside triphosphate hydrolase protein [Aulographum hederae CBS 113979]
MPGPMYARYVPPKAQKNPQATSRPLKPTATPSTQPEIPQPLVASKKEKKLKQEKAEDSEKKQKSRSENSKKRKTPQLEEHEHEGGDDDHGAELKRRRKEPSVPIKSSTEGKKKEKRRKPKKEDNSTASESGSGAEDDSDEVSKAHERVLAKWKKSSKISEDLRKKETTEDKVEEQPPELHDLVPLPQPEQVPDEEYRPTFSTLPPWLAQPTTVSSSTKTPFKEMNINPKLVEHLSSKGLQDASAVQSAVLPLLLANVKERQHDVCVSAATGSGKTLAYILPLIESLRNYGNTELRAVVVVPTRELVSQVRDVVDLCKVGTHIQVGVSVGNQSFQAEREQLIQRSERCDSEATAALEERASKRVTRGGDGDDDLLDEVSIVLPKHFPGYTSKVDLLICTPGRLVDHITSTRGFSLDSVEWLVVDEADRLLDERFQEWVDVVLTNLESEKTPEKKSAPEQISSYLQYPPEKRQITKVVLSATMTRDLEKLGSLRLRRPVLVTVTNPQQGEKAATEPRDEFSASSQLHLPPTLVEWAIPVDESEKPLFLLQLLKTKSFAGRSTKTNQNPVSTTKRGSAELLPSAGDSSSISSSSSDDSDSASDSSDSDKSNTLHDAESKGKSGKGSSVEGKVNMPNVLIFTRSNENTARLAHLLKALHPPYAELIGTLNRSASSLDSRKLLAAFRKGKKSIIIASDRASRGLDVRNLQNIVNYDMPKDLQGYVHRVGRTARAGESGQAWTLYENAEGRWFWNSIAKAKEIERGERRVERIRLDMEGVDERMREAYEKALQGLQSAVLGPKN